MRYKSEFNDNELLSFKVGTGKDASIYLRLKVEEKGQFKIYNVPIASCNSLQLFTVTPKSPIHCMGSANAQGMHEGHTSFSGHVIMNVERESLATRIRRLIKEYRPLEGDLIELEDDGFTITLKEALKLEYMDQLPPCAINLFLTNPYSKKTFMTSIKGVTFTKSQSSIGGGSITPVEAFSFIAQDFDELDEVKISVKETTGGTGLSQNQ